MDPRMKKNNSSKSGSDNPSPILLRRRLSAPETVMRKYKLARARSQESDADPSSESKFGEFSYDSHSGSEINLQQKKKDTAVMMRKSTLLRRLMNNPKTLGSSSFQEWQHYCGKLSTPSLNSLQGSPEHNMSKSYSRRSLIGYEYKTSPKHIGSKKVSPVHQLYETHKKSPVHLASMSPKRKIENHGVSYQVQTTKHRETIPMSSLRSSVNDLTHSKTTYPGQSDSAYSIDRSNFASTYSSNDTNLTTQESILYKNGRLENQHQNMDQRIVDENRNFSVDTSLNYVKQETSTQTTSTTNLNVISNVTLSQKTLDLIVSEVMKDVQKSCTNGNDIQDQTGGSVHVRKISGFNVNSNGTIERPNDSLKLLNDARLQDDGHNFSRISVISSKSSMGEIEDHSDVASLADSLEETSSSRVSLRKYDDKPVRGDLPPIPMRGQKKLISTKPPDVFFIPMKTEAETTKSVSDYLPEKLKEKILRRQKNRQEKVGQFKDNDFLNSKEPFRPDSKSKHVRNKARFRKPFLPSIESFRKTQKESRNQEHEEKNNSKKSKRTSQDNTHRTSKKSKSTGKYDNEGHYHRYKSENDYLYEGGPKRIYHKAEFRNSNRRIEILEIMECVDIGEKHNRITTRTKSRIPVLRNQKLTPRSISPLLMKKATLLDLSEVLKVDPNLDQLITDILIQSLHKQREAPAGAKTSNSKEENKEESQIKTEKVNQQSSNEHNEHFLSQVKSTNESWVQASECEINANNIETNQVPPTEAAIFDNNFRAVTTSKNSKDTQTLTDDWVQFYLPLEKEEPLNQAPNEGRKPMAPKVEMKDRHLDRGEEFNYSSEDWRRNRGEYDFERNAPKEKNDFYKEIILPPPVPKRYGHSSRRPRYRNSSNGNPTPGEWSIILSGTNNATLASDLEMKIRFPSSHRTNCFPFNSIGESGKNRENTSICNDDTRFPHMDHKHFNNFANGPSYYNENNGRFRKLPGINNLRDPDNQRVSDPIAALRAMEITDIRPRQTKTSLKRYNMTRPKLHPLFESNIDNSNIESHYTGMLNPVPDLLSINGYSVSPDNKYNVPGFGGRVIPRHSCTSNDISQL